MVFMATNDTKRFRIRTNEVNLADDGSLRWVSLLPEGRINAHGTVWDLSADKTDADKLRFRFDDVVSSLEDWLQEFAPPIAVEHQKDGTAAGYLRSIRVLTKEEAAKLGIKQPSPRMIYGGLDVTSPEWAARFDAGEVPYISPNIRASASTELDGGARFPFAIGEVSFVTVPQIKTQQVPVAAMRGVSLSEGGAMKFADMMGAYCAELGLDQAKVEELLKMVSAAAMAEAPKLEEVSIEVEAKKEDEEAVKAEEEAPMSEIASLRAELQRVKRSAASEKVKSAIAGRKVSSATEALLTDALVAGKTATFDALLSDLAPVSAKAAAAAPRTVSPVAPGISHGNSLNLSEVMGNMTKWNDLSDAEQVRAISDLAEKEGVDPIDAWCWIRDGKAPTAVEEKKANLRFTQN
jgi:hypothetical protein